MSAPSSSCTPRTTLTMPPPPYSGMQYRAPRKPRRKAKTPLEELEVGAEVEGKIALAAEAFGADQVIGIALPSAISSQHSRDDAAALAAGCSMADMAEWDDVCECWSELERILDGERVIPVTYVNSSAAVKAFVGMHGGACCTSSTTSWSSTPASSPRRWRTCR